MISVCREIRDDQVALFIVQEISILMPNEKCVPPATGSRSVERFPLPVARRRLQAAKLTVTADSKDVGFVDPRRWHDGMQSVRVFFVVTVLFFLIGQRQTVHVN